MNNIHTISSPTTLETPGQGGHSTMPSFDYQGIKESIKQSVKQMVISMPIVTCSILALSLSMYGISLIFYWISVFSGKSFLNEWDLFGERYFSLNPDAITRRYEVWRLLTYPFFHLSFFHILFNLFAVIPLSSNFERRVGTVQYLIYLIPAFILIPSTVYTLLSLIPMSFFASLPSTIGSSGLFFTLSVWKSTEYPESSFCGLCNIHPQMYPLLLLLVISLIFPSASFLGHFLGLWVGYLYVYKFLGFLELRSDIKLSLENSNPFLFIKNKFPHRFADYDSCGFSLHSAPVLPLFHEQNPNQSSSLNNQPASGSDYTPLFQNTPSVFGFSNAGAAANQNQNSTFSGQGRRLGD
ncbi:hypothetical protein K502DRAFT_362626 [Neoconidiobolus thromboides FSU 785]|nr:hypothetical protein K502DRAFT_362626 [Neoconidiobolus thromboides FSU 785]